MFKKQIKCFFVTLFCLFTFIISQSICVYSSPDSKDYFTGIDLSYHNGLVNWEEVKNSGKVQFAILRTSFGWSKRDKFTDKELKNNIKGAKAVGIPIGAYHYSYATNTQQAIWEADFFIDRLKWTQWEYPAFIDFEDPAQLRLNNRERTDIVITFLNRVESAGYYAGFYTCLNWTKYKLEIDRLTPRYQLWVAQWNKQCDCQKPYSIWQCTNNGSIPGIDKRVDLDICYKNYPKIMKKGHFNGF